MTEPPTDGSNPPRRRILLVDDDDLVRGAVARVLRREFEVDTAATAEDAIAKIADDLTRSSPTTTSVPASAMGAPFLPRFVVACRARDGS